MNSSNQATRHDNDFGTLEEQENDARAGNL